MAIHEFLIIALLILISGLFAMTELALLSCSRAKLEQMGLAGDTRAESALKLLEAPTTFLTTMQMGITVLSIVIGIYCGFLFGPRIGELLSQSIVSPSYAQPVALILVTIGITYFTLVFGEIIPKRIALAYPEPIAKFITPGLLVVVRFIGPVFRAVEFSAEKVMQLAPRGPTEDPQVTEDEIKFFIEQGAESGAIEGEEAAIMSKVFHLRERTVRSVMTPRNEIVWLDAATPTAELWTAAIQGAHSYLPLCEADLDHVIGLIHVADFAQHFVENRDFDLRKIAKDPLRVPVTIPLLSLIEKFRETKWHIAVVFDEYGGTKGIVSLHDLVEALLGELQSPREGAPSIRRRADGSVIIDASADMFEVCTELGLPEVDQKEGSYHSLGGFLLNVLGHIPVEGESIRHRGYEFEVIDMDKYRIDKVLVRPVMDEEGEQIES